MFPKIPPPLDPLPPPAAKKNLQVRYGFFFLQFHSIYERFRTAPIPDTDAAENNRSAINLISKFLHKM